MQNDIGKLIGFKSELENIIEDQERKITQLSMHLSYQKSILKY